MMITILRCAPLLAVTLAACVPPAGDSSGPVQIPLDQAALVMGIRSNGTTAKAAAFLISNEERSVEMTGGQSITVGGEELAGPSNVDGFYGYAATIEPADQYEIRVVEPSRGVTKTTVQAPDDFEVTAPTENASLSGFTISWTVNDDDAQVVLITITQNPVGGGDAVVESIAEGIGNTGSYEVGPLDGFGSNLDMEISVTKAIEQNVRGVASGVVSVERTASITVTATP